MRLTPNVMVLMMFSIQTVLRHGCRPLTSRREVPGEVQGTLAVRNWREVPREAQGTLTVRNWTGVPREAQGTLTARNWT